MRRRFRRKSKGLWLPVLGTPGVKDSSGTYTDVRSGISGQLTTTIDLAKVHTILTPIVPDTQGLIEAGIGAALTANWTDELGTQFGWMCKRILGTLTIGYPQFVSTGGPKSYMVGAGFFVAPSQPGSEERPAGANSLSFEPSASAAEEESFFGFSPLSNTTSTFPWMWRRVWCFGNGSATSGVNYGFPPNNVYSQGAQEGNRVDIKTRRHVRPGQRVYLAISHCAYPLDDTTIESSSLIDWRLDVRVFGSLTKPRLGASFR